MESKHTPITWHLDDSVRPVRVVADGLIICEIPPHAAGLDIDIGRRIAAAPDLLEALLKEQEWRDREAAGALDPEWDYETIVGQYRRAAIAKATWEATC